MSIINDFFDEITDEMIDLEEWGDEARPAPKLRFHEGRYDDQLKLFRLPHKEADERFDFDSAFM